MKTKPIIFNSEMVRAILSGKKTQTRRIVKEKARCCPYQVGDILWVRENFYVLPFIWEQLHNEQPIHYAADGTENFAVEDWVQKSSIHMPRWAARIFLKVKDIRAERIQEITEEDAKAEGVYYCMEHVHYDNKGFRCEFERLWDKINKKRGFGWDKNPWVWVIEFEKISHELH